MSFVVDEEIEAYAEAHTTPSGELWERLAQETRETTTAPGMMVGELEGRFLEFLVGLSGAKRILEIGAFTGYSSLSMARSLPPGGKIVSLDIDEQTTAIARRYAEEAGFGEKIEHRVGPALDTIAQLEGPFDLVFIDADKENYVNYYEATLPLLADDGLLILDNTLWSGRVADPAADDELTGAIRAVNDRVRNDERVECVLLTVRDGMLFVRKRARA